MSDSPYVFPQPRKLSAPKGFNPRKLNEKRHPKKFITMMCENNSFWAIFGGMQNHFGPEFHGVHHGPDNVEAYEAAGEPGPWFRDEDGLWHCYNPDLNGNRYVSQPTTWTQVPINPEHSYQDTMRQLSHEQMGDNLGFIANYQSHYPKATPEQLQHIVNYYPEGFLKGFHTLARFGVIFDNWAASFRGPTWPNRWMHLAGTTRGYGNMPEGNPLTRDAYEHWFSMDCPTIFSQMRDAGVPFRVYYHDTPVSMLIKANRDPSIMAHYFPIEQLWEDLKKHPDEMPDFIYIEPCYQGPAENDGHPPQDFLKTDWFITHLYNSVRANEELWQQCAIQILWDEHGGYFDSRFPGVAVQPDEFQHEDPCTQLGVRVPTLLISPLLPHGYSSEQFENCSWNAYWEHRLGLEHLSNRTAAARSFAHLFELPGERPEYPQYIDYPEPPSSDPYLEAETAEQINHLHAAQLHGFKYIGLYGFPRFYSKLSRRMVRLDTWLHSHRAVQDAEHVFHVPGLGKVTHGKDGVRAYQRMCKLTDRAAQSARRKHFGRKKAKQMQVKRGI